MAIAIFVILFSILPSYLAGNCSYGSERNDGILICSDINKEDLLYHIYENVDEMITNSYLSIDIKDSNLPEIGSWLFSPISSSVALTSSGNISVKITNSSIENVEENTFTDIRLHVLDLSYNNIHDTVFVNNTRYTGLSNLNLSYNNIASVGTDVLYYASYVDLSNNQITEFKDASNFRSFRLNLSRNSITSVSLHSPYYYNGFNIDFSYNNIEEYEETYDTTSTDLSYNVNLKKISFVSEKELRSLYFKGNDLNAITSEVSVRHFDISDSTNIITTDLFKNVDIRGHLISRNNRIPVLDNDVFNVKSLVSADYVGLIEIDLSNCSITDIKEYYFSGRFQSAKVILRLNDNNIEVLKDYAFNNTSVTLLDLSNSNILEIEPKAFAELQVTDKLLLQNNKLTTLDNVFNNISVNELDLSFNPIQSVDSNTFSNCRDLKILKLVSTVDIDIDPYTFSTVSSLTYLELSFTGEFKPTFRNLQNLNLKTLIIRNSAVSLLKNDSFKGLYNLVELRFVDSTVTAVEPSFLNGLFKLKYLDSRVIFNGVTQLPINIFKSLKSLESLDLSNISLTIIAAGTFEGLDKLLYLNLSSNSIRSLNSNSFIGLNSLKNLSLDHNLLTTTNRIFQSLQGLEHLNVSYNKISSTQAGFFSNLNNLRVLDLTSNSQLSIFDVASFYSMKRLEFLNIDINGVYNLDYQNLLNYCPNLKQIIIRRNSWKCKDLAQMLYYFDQHSVSYLPLQEYINTAYDINNIGCYLS